MRTWLYKRLPQVLDEFYFTARIGDQSLFFHDDLYYTVGVVKPLNYDTCARPWTRHRFYYVFYVKYSYIYIMHTI